jgi:hypothetical protein
MTSATPKRPVSFLWPVAITTWVQIWLEHRWPGSLAHRLAFWANLLLVLVWFGYQVWTGYQRRQPYWTRESWLRYLWLTWMPVAAVALFLTGAYALDPGVLGRPAPIVGIVPLLGLAVFGVIGVYMAINWLTDGEPSEQFTRTGWFRRRRRKSEVRS